MAHHGCYLHARGRGCSRSGSRLLRRHTLNGRSQFATKHGMGSRHGLPTIDIVELLRAEAQTVTFRLCWQSEMCQGRTHREKLLISSTSASSCSATAKHTAGVLGKLEDGPFLGRGARRGQVTTSHVAADAESHHTRNVDGRRDYPKHVVSHRRPAPALRPHIL